MEELRAFLKQVTVRAHAIQNGEQITVEDQEEASDIVRRSFTKFNLHRQAQEIDEMVSKAISLWNICVRLAANEKRKEEEVLSEVYGREIALDVILAANLFQRNSKKEIEIIRFLIVLASRWLFCSEIGEPLQSSRDAIEKAKMYLSNFQEDQNLEESKEILDELVVSITKIDLKWIGKTLKIDPFFQITSSISSLIPGLPTSELQSLLAHFFNCGLAFYNRNFYDEAITVLEFAAKLVPAPPAEKNDEMVKSVAHSLHLLARCYLLLKKFQEAREAAEKANQWDPSPRIIYLLCVINCELGEKENAVKCGLQLIHHSSSEDFVDLSFQSIDRLLDRNWALEAKHLSDQMMEKNDSSDPALFHVQCKIMQRQIAALLILEEESWDKMTIEGEEPEQNFSVSAFAIADKWIGGTKNRALVVDSSSRKILVRRIQIHSIHLFQKNEYELCIEWLKKASDLEDQGGDNQSHLARQIGRAYYELFLIRKDEDEVQAASFLEKSLQYARKSEYLDPVHLATSYLIETILLQKRDISEASKHLSKMIELIENGLSPSEDAIAFMEAIAEEAVQKQQWPVAKRTLESLLFSKHLPAINPARFGKVFTILMKLMAQEKEKVDEFDVENQLFFLTDFDKILSMCRKKFEDEGKREWFEDESSVTFLSNLTWNLGLETKQKKLFLMTSNFFECSLMFMDFYTTVLTQEQQDFQEKASLLSIQALLDFSTRTPDKSITEMEVISAIEKVQFRMSTLRAKLPSDQNSVVSDKDHLNYLRSTLFVVDVISKFVLKNYSSVSSLIQSSRILSYVIPDDLIRLAVFFSTTHPRQEEKGKQKEWAQGLLMASIERMKLLDPIPWQSIGESLHLLVKIDEANPNNNLEYFKQFQEIIKIEESLLDSSLIQWFIVTGFNFGQKLARQGSIDPPKLQEAEAWFSCAMALNQLYAHKNDYEETIASAYGKTLDALNRIQE